MMRLTETFDELLYECKKNNAKIYEIAQNDEAFVQDISIETLRQIINNNIVAMEECIENGLTHCEPSVSGLSGTDCVRLKNGYEARPALLGKLFENITLYALASAEENARMGKIVACPTAGSCGIVPAVLVACAKELKSSKEENIQFFSYFTPFCLKLLPKDKSAIGIYKSAVKIVFFHLSAQTRVIGKL